MSKSKREVILVRPEAYGLVRAGTAIIEEAEARRAEREATGGGICPILEFNSKEEGAIVQKMDQLAREYQKKHGLAEPPTLVTELQTAPPAVTSTAVSQATVPQTSVPKATTSLPSVPTGTFHFFDRSSEKGPSHIQLENLLITRVPLRRSGETLYVWNGTCYQRMAETEIRTLIRQYLDQELSINGNAMQLQNVQTLLCADPRIQGVPLESGETDLLCLTNGLLDLKTLQLLPANADFFFTSRIEVAWLGAQMCRNFDAFLHQTFGGDPTLIKRMWQVLGYALAPDNRAKVRCVAGRRKLWQICYWQSHFVLLRPVCCCKC